MKLRKIVALLAGVVASLALVVPSASASEVCYSLSVNVNGDDIVNEAGCQDLP